MSDLSGPVRREGDGFVLGVDAEDRATLVGLIGQLRDEIAADGRSEHLRRLFPAAYHDHAEHEAEYQRLVHEDLASTRLASLVTVGEVLGCDPGSDELELGEDDLDALMRALNDLRLVIGTLLDVSEDTDAGDVGPDDPDFGHFQLYGYLGWLLEGIVQARMGG
ncbi:MAG: DUF2017 family protein [Acidobacteria bacterium]|nr:DUF2017 family protein [Acidobacteriota bacterium]